MIEIDESKEKKVLSDHMRIIKAYLQIKSISIDGLETNHVIVQFAATKFQEMLKPNTSLIRANKWLLFKIKSGRLAGIRDKNIKNTPKKPKRIDKTKVNGTERYKQFLLSEYWITVRDCVIHRDGNKCKGCGNDKYLQVHHLSYDNHMNEHNHTEDLITLCKDCHKKAHLIG